MASYETEASQQTRYIRVTGVRNERFVEFNFSIGDPSIFVELVLPFQQFNHFCHVHQAQSLSAEQKAQVDLESLKWRYGEPDTASPNQ